MERKVSKQMVLRVVNRMRGAAGMKALTKLPKGKVDSDTACCLAKALGGTVDGEYVVYSSTARANAVARTVRKGREGNRIVMPMTLQNFVGQFDDHAFPELELN